MKDPTALIVERVIDTLALLVALVYAWSHWLGGREPIDGGAAELLYILAFAWFVAKYLYTKRVIPVTG